MTRSPNQRYNKAARVSFLLLYNAWVIDVTSREHNLEYILALNINQHVSEYIRSSYGSQPMRANGTLLRVAKNKFTIEIHKQPEVE